MKEPVDLSTLVRLVLKLSGLALALFACVQISALFGYWLISKDEQYPILQASLIAPVAVSLFAGLFLWWFPAPIANTVLAHAPVASRPSPDWTRHLQAIAFSLMGLYFMIRGLRDAAYVAILHSARGDVSGQLFSDNTFYAELGAAIVTLAIGIFLLIGAGGMVAVLHRLREVGLGEKRPPPVDSETESPVDKPAQG